MKPSASVMWLQETYRAMFVLDSHCDTPSQIYRLTDIGRRNTRGHVDFPRMKEGGVEGAFFALYVPPGLSPAESTSYALELFATLEDAVYGNPDKAAFASSPVFAVPRISGTVWKPCSMIIPGTPILAAPRSTP